MRSADLKTAVSKRLSNEVPVLEGIFSLFLSFRLLCLELRSSAQHLQQPHIMSLVADSELGVGGELQIDQSMSPRAKDTKLWFWLRLALYAFLVLAGQTSATLLGRLYYEKGGNSVWMQSLVPLLGFPVFIPYLFTSSYKKAGKDSTRSGQPSPLVIGAVYIFLGLLVMGVSMLYAIGLLYLPVSTYSLICASQLAFNALFSYFLNSQKFTPLIINSLVLLTISSALLVFRPDADSLKGVSESKYVIGFICTVSASAGYALQLSLTQLAFRKVIKKESVAAMVDLIVYPAAIAAVTAVVGLFASGEWNSLTSEMNSFKLGRCSYVSTLVGAAFCWLVFSVGTVGLICEVSALFSNVIGTLGLPAVPVFAVVFFNDKMDGIKIIALILAVWGFVSYVYQQYMDEMMLKTSVTSLMPEPTSLMPEGASVNNHLNMSDEIK